MAEDTPDEPPSEAKKPRGRAPKGTAIEAMADEDRQLVTRTARRAYQILEIMVDRLYDDVVEASGVPKLNRDNAQAMLNLQKMAAGMLEAHPGLLAELHGEGIDPEATDEEVEGMLEALDV